MRSSGTGIRMIQRVVRHRRSRRGLLGHIHSVWGLAFHVYYDAAGLSTLLRLLYGESAFHRGRGVVTTGAWLPARNAISDDVGALRLLCINPL